jgi:hypothetical protein
MATAFVSRTPAVKTPEQEKLSKLANRLHSRVRELHKKPPVVVLVARPKAD